MAGRPAVTITAAVTVQLFAYTAHVNMYRQQQVHSVYLVSRVRHVWEGRVAKDILAIRQAHSVSAVETPNHLDGADKFLSESMDGSSVSTVLTWT